MPVRLNTADPDFPARFKALLDTKREASADVDAAVRAIVQEVIDGGDEALIALSKKFDRVDLARVGLKVSPEEIDAGAKAVLVKHLGQEFWDNIPVAFHRFSLRQLSQADPSQLGPEKLQSIESDLAKVPIPR